MYKKMEPALRISAMEASEMYPDSYMVMRMDSYDLSNDMGTVLYIGDDGDELFSLVMKMDDRTRCGVVDGLNHWRSLGGIVVGA